MSQSSEQHRAEAPRHVRCVVVTVSDTRTLSTDSSGATIVELLEAAGHVVIDRRIVADDPGAIGAALDETIGREEVDAILLTGGTGVASRDLTYETVVSRLTKVLPGYGELFRLLSYQQIGPAAMLSRALGGLAGRTVTLTMPGSRSGTLLAMEKIILPELGHLVREARR